MTDSRSDYRAGMRRLAASVCVITTEREGGVRNGLTATAVCSIAADPPTLLCSLNRESHSFKAIVEAGVFAVNVLSQDDDAVAHQFAGERPAAEKFQAGSWGRLATGAPVLQTSLVTFDCRLSRMVEVATHGLLIGEVVAVSLGEGAAAPLLYAEGGYGRFTARDALLAATAA